MISFLPRPTALLGFLIVTSSVVGQEAAEFVQVKNGTLPLVLSAPHGGTLKPSSLPNRTEGVKTRDSNVREVALELADAIEVRTGWRPFVVTTTLHRIKLDLNREIEEAAQGGEFAEEVWGIYHSALEEASAKAMKAGGGSALVLDIHGHGHKEDWIEIGHAVSISDLAKDDAALDALPETSAEWIRGRTSIGAALTEAGFRAVPSPEIPHPDGKKYFNGGYITRRHRGEGLRSIQLELPSSVRKTANREHTVPQMAEAICSFLAQNFSIPVLPLKIQAIPKEGPLSAFKKPIAKEVSVFGIPILATQKVSPKKLKHAATVLAEYLDNDENGAVDDGEVISFLLEEGAFLVMPEREREMEDIFRSFYGIENSGWRIGQDLYGSETFPNGPPHRKIRGRFDAALEEIWHLVSNGWAGAYPEAFSYEPGSQLCDAMDIARGGRFEKMPRRYPENAWYHYDDRTCDYGCMAAEYFYWSLTTLLNGQDYPGRSEEIRSEWRCSTPESLHERDKGVVKLLQESGFKLPTTLPDGNYRH
ncbi:MAG: hypothetical protein QGH51_10050 [Planctomycetota bacterium]|nr:hypothetical protein [Planctomycetota bacterium]MDP6942352.1 hypothetical protein [Planctomycetota bacterium]